MALSNRNDKIYLATKSAADDRRSRFSAQRRLAGFLRDVMVQHAWNSCMNCIEIDSNRQDSGNQQLISFLFFAELQILTFAHGPSYGAWLCAEAATLQLISVWFAYYCG